MEKLLMRDLKKLSREYIFSIWQQAKNYNLEKLNEDDRQLAKIMLEHEDEFFNYFEFADILNDVEYDNENEVNPFLHIIMHSIIEKQLQTKEPLEVSQFYNSMRKNQLSHHDTIHLLCNILVPMIINVIKEKESFNIGLYTSFLSKYKNKDPEQIYQALEKFLKNDNLPDSIISDEFVENSWQYQELINYLQKNKNDLHIDSKNVYLSNPEQKEMIDTVIENFLFLGILNGLNDAGINTDGLKNDLLLSSIEDKYHKYTKREISFLLEDIIEPLDEDELYEWSLMIKIQCSLFDYSISFDLNISFPDDYSINKIIKIIKNEKFVKMPPVMSYSIMSDADENYLNLLFHKEFGSNWGSITVEEACMQIAHEIELQIDVINAVEKMDIFSKSYKFINLLKKSLERAYMAC